MKCISFHQRRPLYNLEVRVLWNYMYRKGWEGQMGWVCPAGRSSCSSVHIQPGSSRGAGLPADPGAADGNARSRCPRKERNTRSGRLAPRTRPRPAASRGDTAPETQEIQPSFRPRSQPRILQPPPGAGTAPPRAQAGSDAAPDFPRERCSQGCSASWGQHHPPCLQGRPLPLHGPGGHTGSCDPSVKTANATRPHGVLSETLFPQLITRIMKKSSHRQLKMIFHSE